MAVDAFRCVTDLSDVDPSLRGAVVAIGNFDGVHRGHRAVLDRALAEAKRRGVPAIVLTFEPHPRDFFATGEAVFRLTPLPMKARLVRMLGFDALVALGFDGTFANQSADDFVDAVLVRGLGISHAVTGFDFHFGRQRGGGPAFLMAAGEARGFGVSLVDAFRDEDAEIVSSSRIRGLLEAGDVAQAAGLLGYRFTVEAPVSAGRQLGRTLGYPTANMMLPDCFRLAHGIYAVRLRRADGSLHDGVASFGRRPTVEDDGVPLLETFVFDFSGDLYGEDCTVSFFGRLRGEEKFETLDALMVQVRRDEAEARALLSGVRPLGPIDAAVAFG